MRTQSYWHAVEDRTFMLLIVTISLAFGWILWPFYGAILWGVALAILFAPLYRRLSRAMRHRRTLAALATIVIILVLVILPLVWITASLLQEGSNLFARLQSGELNPGKYFRDIFGALPTWVTSLLDRYGLTNLSLMQERLAASLTRGSEYLAAQALSIGQNTFDFIVSCFIMVYLLFFLLRDGEALARRIKNAIPLRADHLRDLFAKLAIVIRATVKGNIVLAILQGALGGLMFWILDIHAPVLWGALMAFLSLLPAVGAALVWAPVAVYLLVTGAVWQAVILIVFGVLVIGLVDNVLRPILVGKDTKMPDFIVLFSTLGGIAIFGLNGFVIGPVIAAMFIAGWEIFSTARSEAVQQSR